MDPRIRELFERALEQPPARRAVFLRRATAGDAGLRREVESLLDAHARMGRFLEGAADQDRAEPWPEVSGYRLERLLGEGGYGRVFLAEELGELQRRVALKVMREELGGGGARLRFDRERRILASLQHDGIARIFAAGELPDGRLWYAMEWVDGPSLIRFCDEHTLPIRTRIDLFVRLCCAVTHAHQRGVLHGDLKPANVLVCAVDDRPMPKVIDFGVSRFEHDLADPSGDRGANWGTPYYMAPEQRSGTAVLDTRSDVHSLGVMLGELLVGRFDGHGSGPLVPRVRGLAPEERLRRARARGASPQAWMRRLTGDLDAIVARATHPDPDVRYPSVEALADDCERALQLRPVAARPIGPLNTVVRFVRRRPLSVVAGLLAVAVPLLAVALGHSQRAADRADVMARHWEAAADDVLDFLEEMFRAVEPERAGPTPDVATLLQVAAARAGERFADSPLVGARVWVTLGRSWMAVGEAARAEQCFERSREALGPLGEAVAVQRAIVAVEAARAAIALGAADRGEALLAEALPPLREHRAQAFSAWLAAEIQQAFQVGRHRGIEAGYRLLEELWTQVEALGRTESRAAQSLLLDLIERAREAGHEPRARQLEARFDGLRVQGADGVLHDLQRDYIAARAEFHAGRLAEADRLGASLLQRVRASLGADDRLTFRVYELLGAIARKRYQGERSVEMFRAAHLVALRLFGRGHPRALQATANLALAEIGQGAFDAAAAVLEASVEDVAALPADTEAALRLRFERVGIALLAARGEQAEALTKLEGVLGESVARDAALEQHELRRLGVPLWIRGGDYERAERELAALRERPVVDGPVTVEAELDVDLWEARLEHARGRPERALEILAGRTARAVAELGPASSVSVDALRYQASLLLELGRTDRARELTDDYRRRFVEWLAEPGRDPADREVLARLLLSAEPESARDPAAAVELLRPDIESGAARVTTWMLWSEALYRAGDLQGALAAAESAARLAPEDPRVVRTLDALRAAAARSSGDRK